MSILFTNKELIEYCIKVNFSNNSIKHLKYINNFPIISNESVIHIKDKTINVIQQNPNQDKIRFNYIVKILKYAVSKLDDLDCKIILNICDGVRSSEKYTRLCFSCETYSNHIAIPDPHIFQYFNFTDNNSYENKIDKVLFIGSDTGSLGEDLLNERIRFCKEVEPYEDIIAKISNFVHFNNDMLNDLGVDKTKIESSFMPIDDQLKYKFILNINGNTSSWDRIPWGMYSNSYLLHLKSDFNEKNWYHPFIEKNNALESVTKEQLVNKKIKYNHDRKNNQKSIAKLILQEKTQLEYFTKTLFEYNRIYNL